MKKHILLILFLFIGLNTKLFADGCYSAYAPTLSASAGVSGAAGVSGTMICSGSSVTLTASGSINCNTNWTWYPGGCGGASGPVGTGSQVVVHPTVATTYYCRGEGGGYSPGNCGQITINNFYQLSAPVGTDASQCSSGSLVLSATVNAGETIDWYGAATGGNVLAGGNGTNSYTTPVISTTTTYYAQTRNLTTGCTSLTRTPVYAIIGVFAVASGNGPLCAGNTLNFHSSGGASGYSWTGPNGFSSSLQNPVNSNPGSADSGTYTVTVTNPCGSTSSSINVIINRSPPAIISAGGPTTICSGNSVTLNANAGSGLSYQWQRNGSNLSGATASSFVASTTGNYICTVSNTNCSSISNTISITVNQTPSPVISGNLIFCSGSSTILSTSTFSSYIWSTGETTQSVIVSIAGTFTVTVTNSNNCSASASTQVIVNQTPIINPVGNQTLCNGTSTAAINFSGTGSVYNWTNNTPSIGLAGSGTGTIATFTATNSGASPITATITVTPSTSTAGGYAYIANNHNSSVSVINTSTNTVTATIAVGSGPTSISVSSDGSRVYVSNTSDNSVSVINTASNTVTATIGVGSDPYALSVTPDGSKVYVANYYGNSVSVISTATNTVIATVAVGSDPNGTAVSPDGSMVYIANIASNTVSVINTSSNTVTATIAVGHSPNGITVSPDGSKVYVADRDDNAVAVINAATNTVIATIAIGSNPNGIAVSPDGSRVYTTNLSTNNVSVINTATNAVIVSIAVGNYPVGISVCPDGSLVYAVNYNSNTVSAINATTNTVIATIGVGSAPFSNGNFITGTICSGAPSTFNVTVNPTSAGSASVTGCGSYIWNGTIYTSSGDITYHTANSSGCDSTAILHLTITGTCSATLNLKIFLQGYCCGYLGNFCANNGAMQNVLYNEGVENNPNSTNVDTVRVSLVDPSNGTVVQTSKGILQTDGALTVMLPGAAIGNSYYIYVRHRNSILTSSNSPVAIGVTTNYDFSSSSSQAYGNNMAQVAPGIWAIYTGDVNQDFYIDPYDFPAYDADNSRQIAGVYDPADFNGDGYVDPFDFPVYDQNNSLQITANVPW